MRAALVVLALPLHAALMLLAAALLPGLLAAAAATLRGQTAPPPLQAARELRRLLGRLPSRLENASPLLVAAPVASLAAAGLAALLVPSFALGMPGWTLDDLLLVGGLLTLSRLLPALAALDGGAALPGLGASRVLGAAALAQPALLLVLLVLVVASGSSSIDLVAGNLVAGGPEAAGLHAPLALALGAAALLGLAGEAGEAEGLPPLAASEGAMLLALSGRDLALVRAAAALRLATGLTLIGTLFLPFGIAAAAGSAAWPLDWLLAMLCWAGRLLAGTLLLALVRAAAPRARPVGLLGAATLLGLLAAVLLFLAQSLA